MGELNLEEIDSAPPKPDFRRANGAPMIMVDGKNMRVSRPSSGGKMLDDESALTNWKINRAIAGVASDKAIAARASAAKEDDREEWNKLREDAINAGRGSQAADLGTALHAMSERWEDPEDDFDPPDIYKTSLTAYSDCLTNYGLVSKFFEFKTVNLEYRTAGTADRLYELTKPLVTPEGEILPIGTLVVGDLKTGKKLDYSVPGYAVQFAYYAQGEFYDVVNDAIIETPDINQKWAILVHMPVEQDFCDLYWIDLDQGNEGAWLVDQLKQWRKNWRSGAYAATQITPPLAELEGEVIDADHSEFVEQMLPFCTHRLGLIREHPEALKKLAKRWPQDLPKPKEIVTSEQVTTLLDHLDKIEAEFGLTFPGDDPRTTKGVHKSAINNSNKEVSK